MEVFSKSHFNLLKGNSELQIAEVTFLTGIGVLVGLICRRPPLDVHFRGCATGGRWLSSTLFSVYYISQALTIHRNKIG